MKKTKVISDMVMVTREFGYDIFIAPLKNLNIQTTDKREDAELWSADYDQMKLAYHKSITGYKGLKFEKK